MVGKGGIGRGAAQEASFLLQSPESEKLSLVRGDGLKDI